MLSRNPIISNAKQTWDMAFTIDIRVDPVCIDMTNAVCNQSIRIKFRANLFMRDARLSSTLSCHRYCLGG